jgi:hypothetical protein
MDLTYEQIKANEPAERLMYQWWVLISERERQDTVKGIRGCIEYGCTVMVQRMPQAGKLAVRDAYARHQKLMADLEAAHSQD